MSDTEGQGVAYVQDGFIIWQCIGRDRRIAGLSEDRLAAVLFSERPGDTDALQDHMTNYVYGEDGMGVPITLLDLAIRFGLSDIAVELAKRGAQCHSLNEEDFWIIGKLLLRDGQVRYGHWRQVEGHWKREAWVRDAAAPSGWREANRRGRIMSNYTKENIGHPEAATQYSQWWPRDWDHSLQESRANAETFAVKVALDIVEAGYEKSMVLEHEARMRLLDASVLYGRPQATLNLIELCGRCRPVRLWGWNDLAEVVVRRGGAKFDSGRYFGRHFHMREPLVVEAAAVAGVDLSNITLDVGWDSPTILDAAVSSGMVKVVEKLVQAGMAPKLFRQKSPGDVFWHRNADARRLTLNTEAFEAAKKCAVNVSQLTVNVRSFFDDCTSCGESIFERHTLSMLDMAILVGQASDIEVMVDAGSTCTLPPESLYGPSCICAFCKSSLSAHACANCAAPAERRQAAMRVLQRRLRLALRSSDAKMSMHTLNKMRLPWCAVELIQAFKVDLPDWAPPDFWDSATGWHQGALIGTF